MLERPALTTEIKAFKAVFKHYDGRTNWKCTPVLAWRKLAGVTFGARQAFEAAGCRLSRAVRDMPRAYSSYDDDYYAPGGGTYVSHDSAWLCMPEGKSQAVLLTTDFLMLAMRQCMDGAYNGESILARPHYGVLLASGLRSQRAASLSGLSHLAKQRAELNTTRTKLSDVITTKPTAVKVHA